MPSKFVIQWLDWGELENPELGNNNHLKGCVMVMADPSDLGHGKTFFYGQKDSEKHLPSILLPRVKFGATFFWRVLGHIWSEFRVALILCGKKFWLL